MNDDLFRYMCRYFAAAVVCLMWEAVYEFIAGSYSCCMVIAFLFPLIGGIPYAARYMTDRDLPGPAARRTYAAGITLLTIGALLFGAFEIAGLDLEPPVEFWLSGILLIGIGSLISLKEELTRSRRNPPAEAGLRSNTERRRMV